MTGYDLYTDGGCSPNPGRGGYGGVILLDGKVVRKYYGGEDKTTNNRMEIKAVLQGLKKLPHCTSVMIYTDSMYVVKCFTFEWSRKSNRDLWDKIEREVKRFKRIGIQWVKGHNGDKYNHMADALATKGRST